MKTSDGEKSYQQAAAEALAEFTEHVRKYHEETGQAFPVYEGNAALASITGTISIEQMNKLVDGGLVKIVYDSRTPRP